MANNKKSEVFTIRLTVLVSLVVLIGILITVSTMLNQNGENKADEYNKSVQQQSNQGQTNTTDTSSQSSTGQSTDSQTQSSSQAKIESVSSELMDAIKFKGDAPTFTFPKGYKASSNIGVSVIKKGTGKTLDSSASIEVNYALWNEEGPVAGNNTWENGKSIGFALSGVIPAWSQGLLGQKVGSTVAIFAPSQYAYQDGKNLFFVVEILKAA